MKEIPMVNGENERNVAEEKFENWRKPRRKTIEKGETFFGKYQNERHFLVQKAKWRNCWDNTKNEEILGTRRKMNNIK